MVVIVMLTTPLLDSGTGLLHAPERPTAVILRLQRSSSPPRNRLHRLGLRDVRDLNAHDAAAR